ncbi:YfgM family protein [Mycolicibacterium litorale]
MTMSVTTESELDGTENETEDDTGAQPEEAGDESETAAAPENETVDEEPSRPRRRRALAIVAAVLILGGFATSGYLGWRLWQDHQITLAGEEAKAAAVQYAQILTSIDSDKVDENFDQVLDGATGEFKDMYSQSSMQLRQLLIDNKASAHGVVVDSAIQSASEHTVVVLLFVDQSVSNSAVPDPRIDRSRIKMTMQDVDGRWRASKVELP